MCESDSQACPSEAMDNAWKTEIHNRLRDIEEGRVEPIPADNAEKMIRCDAIPNT
ncbi:hypothetical protein MalM25_07710 [Planctomycetes bacterium MalM25]|nr:hypothetical protein MalM25_07710 [Planctomycetes bacterium MalM25]